MYEDSKKIIRSFYVPTDGKASGLVVNEYVERMIAEKSKGIPIVIRLFFEQRISSHNGNAIITASDADNIRSDAKYYALRQLFNYYLSRLDNVKEISDTLAFLYFIVKNGLISIGHLKLINREWLGDEARKHMYGLKQNRPFPLFSIDNFGIMVPFHDSVSEAIIRLVEDPVSLLAEIPANEQDIIDEIRTVKELCEEIEDDVEGASRQRLSILLLTNTKILCQNGLIIL